jgi:hypothetical protein
MMNIDEIQATMQQSLESVGVPINQARDAAHVLARESVDAGSGQLRERTAAEQALVSSAYEWMKAKANS